MEADAIAVDSTELKLTELLKEVNVDHSHQFSKLVDDTVSAIKTSIDKIPNDFKVTADLASRFVTDIGADKVSKGTIIRKKERSQNSIQSIAKPEVNANMINGLQSRYPIFGPVVRLAKRWAASHLLSSCLVEEAVELLVAYLFLNPLPYDVPCSRITGFLRFLRLLSHYDWTFSPLVVDINHDFSQSDGKEINDNFLLRRKGQGENGQSVGSAMFLATVYDKESEAWTGLSPSGMELKRLVAYAQSSANLLAKLAFKEEIGPFRWECLFRTPLNNYDAVIILHKDKLPYPQRLLFPSEVNHGTHVAEGQASKCFQPFLLPKDLKGRPEELKNKLLVDFDPSKCFIRDLKQEFSTTFQVWHDYLGGDVIGLTWGESYPSKKRKHKEVVVEEEYNPCKVLKAVGEVGKGFVRSIYFIKPSKLMN